MNLFSKVVKHALDNGWELDAQCVTLTNGAKVASINHICIVTWDTSDANYYTRTCKLEDVAKHLEEGL